MKTEGPKCPDHECPLTCPKCAREQQDAQELARIEAELAAASKDLPSATYKRIPVHQLSRDGLESICSLMVKSMRDQMFPLTFGLESTHGS